MNSLKQFFKEEDGAVTIIEILILLAIIVAIALIFREQLMNWVTKMINDIFGTDLGVSGASPTTVPTP